MPRKRRGRPPPKQHQAATPQNDPLLLDEFSQQDLRSWQRNSELLNEYRVRQFYELESLREIHKTELSQALKQVCSVAQTISGWARIVNYRYSLSPLSATGSLLHGGRFNVGKDLDSARFAPFPALYLAENYATAYAERFGAPPTGPGELQPHELALRDSKSFLNVSLKGEVHGLFDLRQNKHLSAFANIIGKFQMSREQRDLAKVLGLKPPLLLTTPKQLRKSLLANWHDMPSQYGLPANSQIFARFLREAGFEGILYPSTKGQGDCMALFLDCLDMSDTCITLSDPAPPETSITQLDATTAMHLY